MSSTSVLRHVFAGGYTAESDGNALGISSLLNTGTGEEIRLVPAGSLGLASPTWLTRHPTLPVLLAAGEGAPATLSSVRWEPDGSLRLLSSVAMEGDGACHVAVTVDGRYAVVSDYGAGLLSVLPIAPDGTLGQVVCSSRLIELGSHGGGADPVRERQAHSHAHQVVVSGDELLAVDLGGDRIDRLRIDDRGTLTESAAPIRLPAGAGPRHLVRAGDHLVVACELSGELWLGTRHEDGGWRRLQVVAASNRIGHIQPSGIATDGTRVFVANRGVDTIGVFDLDRAGHALSPVAEFDCGGAWPRDITLDDSLLWVSNQHSDTVTAFDISAMPPRQLTAWPLPSPTGVVLVHEPPNHEHPTHEHPSHLLRLEPRETSR